MRQVSSIAPAALVSGSVAALVSFGALALMAKAQGRSAMAPVNASAHWLDDNATVPATADQQHTLPGLATHVAACLFWALVFEATRRDRDSATGTIRDGAATAAIAGAVDYGLVPKRLTPGWELVLPKPSVAAGFVAMGAGLALGGLITRRW